jgi:hypothetical protein
MKYESSANACTNAQKKTKKKKYESSANACTRAQKKTNVSVNWHPQCFKLSLSTRIEG